MRSWMRIAVTAAGLGGALAALTFGAGLVQAQTAPAEHPGKAVYKQYCGDCHDDPETFMAPSLESMMQRNRSNLQAALTTGKMREQGAQVPVGELFSLLDYLAVKEPLTDEWLTRHACPANRRAVNLNAPESFTYQGVDADNARHMTAKRAGLTGADLANMEVAWSFGFPQTTDVRTAPVVVGSTVFHAAVLGYVVALDTRTGCVKWSYKTENLLRTSIAYGPVGAKGQMALVLGDLVGKVQAIDAKTGKRLWIVDGRHDPESFLTGSPIIWNRNVYQPVSANDVQRAQNPAFECCKSHGAVVALSGADGKRLWVAHTMETAKPTGQTNSVGTRLWGPSGAIVWSSPAIDPKAGVLFVGTGENTSLPVTKTSDAIWAIDLKTGESKWFFQGLARDAWNMACPRGPNCPPPEESVLKDHDFGAGPIIAQVDGRNMIFGGQKSGDIWGLTDDGYLRWHQKFGQGSALGGVHWGLASDGKRLFVPIAGGGQEGMHALSLATGDILWNAEAPCPAPSAAPAAGAGRGRGAAPGGDGPGRGAAPAGGAGRGGPEGLPPGGQGGGGRRGACRGSGLSAAPLSIDNAVVAATLDGRVVVFDSATGKITAAYNTNQTFQTVNGVTGKGGSVDAQSIGAGDGMLFIGSGYSQFGQTSGNVLVAYRPKTRK